MKSAKNSKTKKNIQPDKQTAPIPSLKKKRHFIKNAIIISCFIGFIFIAYEIVTWPNLRQLNTQNPSSTALIDARFKEAQNVGKPFYKKQTWVSYENISPYLKRAVLAGEDAKFFCHEGFDREAIEKAIDENWKKKKFVRGASTISQQLIKNLYLSESKNPFRKIKEAILTWQMEQTLSKKRILEVYLNVIEWGEGIYGIEEASQHYLQKPASNLSSEESAYLAAMIPNPRTVFNPYKNAKRVNKRKKHILNLMAAIKLPK